MDLDKQLKAVFDGTFVSVASNCDKYAKSHSKKLADKLKEASPKLKKAKKGRVPGKYAKGWESKKTTQHAYAPEYIVRNKTDYQLTHLLENGHAYIDKDGVRQEGPVGKVPHINKAADEEIEEFVKDMEEHCLDNNT